MERYHPYRPPPVPEADDADLLEIGANVDPSVTPWLTCRFHRGEWEQGYPMAKMTLFLDGWVSFEQPSENYFCPRAGNWNLTQETGVLTVDFNWKGNLQKTVEHKFKKVEHTNAWCSHESSRVYFLLPWLDS